MQVFGANEEREEALETKLPSQKSTSIAGVLTLLVVLSLISEPNPQVACFETAGQAFSYLESKDFQEFFNLWRICTLSALDGDSSQGKF